MKYCLSLKADGLSMSAHYREGRFFQAISRGDGITGIDITANAKKFLPQSIKHKGNLIIRGEAILQKETYKKFFADKANPRNAASGTLNRIDTINSEYLDFLTFDSTEELEALSDKLASLEKLGFKTVTHKIVETEKEILTFLDQVAQERSTLPYEYDGIVVAVDSREIFDKFGSKDLKPKAAKCIKFETQTAKTVLREVELTIGSLGHIIPTGKVDPVQIGGVTVSSVLLNNFTYCAKLGIGIGDTILMERGGDVIPHCVRVLEKAAGRVAVVPPSSCPSCGGPLVQDGAYTTCRGSECEGRAIRKIETWISKRNIKFLGTELLAELFENHNIKEPQDLYSLTQEKLASCRRGNGVVGTASKQIFAEIEKSKQCPLQELVGSLCVPFLGRRQAEILIDAGIRTLEQFVLLGEKDLQGIPGFPLDGTKAQGIIEGLKKVRGTIKALLDAGVEVIEPKEVKKVEGGPLAGKVVCFTGCRPTAEEQAQFLALGGIVKSGVSKSLSHLVSMKADSASNKADKARELGVELIGYEDFKAWLATGL